MRLLSPEFLRFRIVFLSANGEHLMTPGIAATCVLPTIDLRRDERLGSQIQVHCATYWSIRCEVIDILGSSGDVGLIVIRLPALDTKNASSPFHRRRIEDLEPSQISQQEFDLLLRLQMTGETGRGPFSRLTWLDDARSWLADVLHVAPNDLRLSQHHVGPCRALLNVATSSERQYWLKGVRGCESGLMHLLEQEPAAHPPMRPLSGQQESPGLERSRTPSVRAHSCRRRAATWPYRWREAIRILLLLAGEASAIVPEPESRLSKEDLKASEKPWDRSSTGSRHD